MNIEEIRRYIERRMGDVGLKIHIDNSDYQAIQNYTRGDSERLNQLYYKLVSVGSRQENREVNGVTIQIAIDDLRRMNEFMEHMPALVEQGERIDTDRVAIEQLASSLEQKVTEEIAAAVAEARAKDTVEADPDVSGNGKDHAAAEELGKLAVAEDTAEAAGKPSILIVDDSPTIRAAVTKALENDFELIEASDGQKGWEILRGNRKIKLIVTDLMMPEMDGFALIERIRSADMPAIANMPIIVVTALEDPQAKVHALMAGANDFITKRTDTLELQARVVARYQLSQIVGNPLAAGVSRAAKESGPPPHEVAAALLGTKALRSNAHGSTNIVNAARRHAKPGAASHTADAMMIPARDHAFQHASVGKRPAVSPWVRALGLDRLRRINPSTAITLVASFLVAIAIAGVLYVNPTLTEPTTPTSEVSTAMAGTESSISPSTDPMQATDPEPASVAGTDGDPFDKPDDATTGEAKTSGLSDESWATADGTPMREQHEPAPADVAKPTQEASEEAKPKRKASNQAVTLAAAQPTPAPRAKPPAKHTAPDVETKPPPAPPATASSNNKPASKSPTPVLAKVTESAPTSDTTGSSGANVEVEPAIPSKASAPAATSNPTLSDPTSIANPTAGLANTAPSIEAAPPTETAAASPDSGAEPLVALAAPSNQAIDPPTRQRLTQEELTKLVHRFVFVYQAGDLQQFLSLFDDKIRTNDRIDKAGLRQDYEDLFRNTSMRQMTLGDITWDINNREAEGAANFEVRVRRINEDRVRVYHGSLTFRVEKIDGRPRIVRMYHGQWKAQS
jgi:CheY-like chemotaxis protein